MKILIPLIGTFGKSGGYRVLSQLANHFIDKGHDVTFLSYIGSEGAYFPTCAKILYYDNSGHVTDYSDNQKKEPFLSLFILRRALRKALDQLDADVVLANHSFTASPVKKSIIKAKKFYYVQAYEPEYFYHKNFKDFILKTISRKSYELGLNIIVNASMYQDYKEIKTHRVVFPGLDLSIFKPSLKNKDDSKIILGTIGRVEAYKGTSYIVEAFKELRKLYGEKIELHVAFGEKYLEEIEGITVVTPDGDNELANYYNSLNIYISAGTVQLEAIHYPVIEAMACKIQVITTGYYPSNKDNSWIIPIKDTYAISEVVQEALTDPDKVKKVERGYMDIKEFDWEYIAEKMLKYFKE